MKSFKDYLKTIHAEQYTGTDDDMPDDFEHWYDRLDKEELFTYALKWGEELFK